MIARLSAAIALVSLCSCLANCASTKTSTYSLRLADGRSVRSYQKPELNEQTRYYRLTDESGRYVLVLDQDVISIDRETGRS